MKKDLFGDKIHYENFSLPFVVVGMISRFNNNYQSVADDFFKEISWKQMYFLNAITLFEEAPSIKDIAKFMGCSHQNANKLCLKLVDDGYIICIHDDCDHRIQRLFLTDKGVNFLSNRREESFAKVKNIFSVVSDEEMELVIDIMERLTKKLKDN